MIHEAESQGLAGFGETVRELPVLSAGPACSRWMVVTQHHVLRVVEQGIFQHFLYVGQGGGGVALRHFQLTDDPVGVVEKPSHVRIAA